MREFIENLRKGLTNDKLCERKAANMALLAYDLGRAETEVERNNARRQFEFRKLAFEDQLGLKKAYELQRKIKKPFNDNYGESYGWSRS